MTAIAQKQSLSATQLRTQLLDGAEIAVVDIREGSAYEAGHVSVSVPIADSELELEIVERVPRLGTRLVIVDATGGDEARAAASRLLGLGYADVSPLDGGLQAWAAAGYELITQPNALSKALGEFVERRYRTPRITVEELKSRLDAGEQPIVLDTRPEAEFRHIAIPTGRLASGAELLYRVFDQLPSDDAPVVVNCAGRTRAIIGAQALINAGLPNPVVSLENGTTAWRLSGYEPVQGSGDLIPAPSPEGLARAREAAGRIRRRFGVAEIDAARLAALRGEAGERTLYVFDIRSPQEYVGGHLAGAASAPGGQLVQATDQYVGTRHSRIVLVDTPDLVRSTVTASWLVQLGLDDIFVYAAGPQDALEHGAPATVESDAARCAPIISADELNDLLGGSGRVTVLDLQPAAPYFRTRRYIAGSLATRRSTLLRDPSVLSEASNEGTVVLVSQDGRLVRLAAIEATHATGATVTALDGGVDAWALAGLPLQTGVDQEPLTEGDRLPPPEDLEARRKSFAEYVAWGDQITEQLRRDGIVSFRYFDAAHPDD
jgi:rhodanese-related sulfurtransferase